MRYLFFNNFRYKRIPKISR